MTNVTTGDLSVVRNPIILENWAVVLIGRQYTRPEENDLSDLHFKGKVFGHPLFPEGYQIFTTEIREFEDGCFVTKSGRRYMLGHPDEVYSRLFGDALNRLILVVEKKSKQTW